MTEVPAATPVTTPVELTVATEGLALTQGVVLDAVPDPVNVVVEPTHTVAVPDIVGVAFTTTVVTEDVVEHPDAVTTTL